MERKNTYFTRQSEFLLNKKVHSLLDKNPYFVGQNLSLLDKTSFLC